MLGDEDGQEVLHAIVGGHPMQPGKGPLQSPERSASRASS